MVLRWRTPLLRWITPQEKLSNGPLTSSHPSHPPISAGHAHTFFVGANDKPRAGELINVLREAKQKVPEDLLNFGTTGECARKGTAVVLRPVLHARAQYSPQASGGGLKRECAQAGRSAAAHIYCARPPPGVGCLCCPAGRLCTHSCCAPAPAPPLLPLPAVKKKESKLYGAHFKDVDHSQKATKVTFDSDSD